MKRKGKLISLSVAILVAVVSAITVAASHDKYSVQVPGGLAFSEFRGYESWEVINVSHGGALAAILGNPVMINAYKAGIPDNGKPFPDGAMMAKVHWNAVKNEDAPGKPTVGGPQHDMDFMVKDSKKYADSGGWGYAEFEYDAATSTFRPGNEDDRPPQAHDAKCGYACHTEAKNRDYVFTRYGTR